jgi:hypothetical protein
MHVAAPQQFCNATLLISFNVLSACLRQQNPQGAMPRDQHKGTVMSSRGVGGSSSSNTSSGAHLQPPAIAGIVSSRGFELLDQLRGEIEGLNADIAGQRQEKELYEQKVLQYTSL